MIIYSFFYCTVTTKPISSIEVESETCQFLSQEEFMTAVDMDEFLEIRNIWVINVYSEVEKEVEEE